MKFIVCIIDWGKKEWWYKKMAALWKKIYLKLKKYPLRSLEALLALLTMMDDILVWKVTSSVSLKKIHFPKISEHRPLRNRPILKEFKDINPFVQSPLFKKCLRFFLSPCSVHWRAAMIQCHRDAAEVTILSTIHSSHLNQEFWLK